MQIAKATAQMAMLRKYFNCPYVELGMKYCTYLASIPLNTVLWGCDPWAVLEGIKRQLSVFHHRSVRQILGIQKVHTAMFKITNKHHQQQTRMHFCNIRDIGEIMTKCQLQWIERIAKMKEDRAPRKFVLSWIANPCKSGRPQISYINTYAEALSTIVTDCNPIVGSNKTWRADWDNTIEQWWCEEVLPPDGISLPLLSQHQ
jgi:hypothetical protein